MVRLPALVRVVPRLLTRLADISASVDAEQAVAELVLQWLPPSIGASQPGAAFSKSQFDFARFTQRLGCLHVAASAGGGNRKELIAKQEEEARNRELVQIVVCVAVCDVLAALLNPRPGRVGTPIDPDIGQICVQLAFGQFNPASDRAAGALHVLDKSLAAALHQRTVVAWSRVVSHLARSRFDQIVNEFIERIHPCKTADEVYHILVGVQRVTIPHLSAPACAPYFDQFRQIVLSDKRVYKEPNLRLCVIYSIELLVRQADCGSDTADPHTVDLLYGKLHAMFTPLQSWAEKPELMVAATQLLSLIVCHAPAAFWQAHMDISKEGKKVSKKNQLLGDKGIGLLRKLLVEDAYEERSSRAALCGVLRLLTGGHPLPQSILGEPTDGEWWFDAEPELQSASLMSYKMRTFSEQPQPQPDAAAAAAAAVDSGRAREESLGWDSPPKRPSGLAQFLGLGGLVDSYGVDETSERLRFIIEKLFARKTSGRHVRMPKLLENGDVLVYIVSQIAAHSLRVGEEAIELLLKDARDLEYNLIGVCALGRILKSPLLASALAPRLTHYAECVQTVIERCEHAVGSRVLGLSQRPLNIASTSFDDSVQLLLTTVTRKKDREIATRLAMYREALGCIPLALPRPCLEPHGFVGELLLHSDVELASMASRVVQRLPNSQTDAVSTSMLRQAAYTPLGRACRVPGAATLAAAPRGGTRSDGIPAVNDRQPCGPSPRVVDGGCSVRGLLRSESLDEELSGSQVIRLEAELVELDASSLAPRAPIAAVEAGRPRPRDGNAGSLSARKAACDRAIVERLAVLESTVMQQQGADATAREVYELNQRIRRVERLEDFAADLIESERDSIVRKAIRRELLESKGGVASELPSEAQLDKMQIPPMEKLFALPAESLSITSQFCYCLAELGGALLNQGAAQRASLLRDLLSSAIERLPAGRDLAAFVAEGDTKLGVLWRNYYCLLLSVAGGTVATTKRLLHPGCSRASSDPKQPDRQGCRPPAVNDRSLRLRQGSLSCRHHPSSAPVAAHKPSSRHRRSQCADPPPPRAVCLFPPQPIGDDDDDDDGYYGSSLDARVLVLSCPHRLQGAWRRSCWKHERQVQQGIRRV